MNEVVVLFVDSSATVDYNCLNFHCITDPEIWTPNKEGHGQ